MLYDSDPEAEEAETELKASALLDAIRRDDGAEDIDQPAASRPGQSRKVLFVDHRDSFVHTLAGYVRATGADVVTLRAGFDPALIDEIAPDLAILSPGPGRPGDFDVSGTVGELLARDVPVFGVCLGLQGIVEHFGGSLGVLDTPVHGKPSTVRTVPSALFAGLPDVFTAGRYHSLYANRETLPECLIGVGFDLLCQAGQRLIENVVVGLKRNSGGKTAAA